MEVDHIPPGYDGFPFLSRCGFVGVVFDYNLLAAPYINGKPSERGLELLLG